MDLLSSWESFQGLRFEDKIFEHNFRFPFTILSSQTP
jgi:hypothetical protein